MSLALSSITTTTPVVVDESACPRGHAADVPLDAVQTPWTGVIGSAVLLGGSLLLAAASTRGWALPGGQRAAVLLLLLVVAVMAGYELAVVKVHRRQFDFAHPRPLGAAQWENVFRRFFGLCGSLFVAFILYANLREYGLQIAFVGLRFQDSWYRSFFAFASVAVVCLLVAAPYYFYLCERYGRWPAKEDELLHAAAGFAALVRGRTPGPRFWVALRAMLVKFFFLPVMVMFWVENTSAFQSSLAALFVPGGGLPAGAAIGHVFECGLQALFVLDVSLATIGYAASTRLLDTQIRSAEPTFLGWTVALACYPPFCKRITEHYFAFVEPTSHWGRLLSPYPGLFVMCGTAILMLLGIYTISTVMFGLRFSNLTNRGILCKGPYAIVRHPAYAAKNLAWWLIGLPFVHSPGDCVRLLVWNALYVVRAFTEERHLNSDPQYREYARRVRYRFIPGLI